MMIKFLFKPPLFSWLPGMIGYKIYKKRLIAIQMKGCIEKFDMSLGKQGKFYLRLLLTYRHIY